MEKSPPWEADIQSVIQKNPFHGIQNFITMFT